jgi:hypothetical protein
MSYGFGYGSLWSLAGLIHAPSKRLSSLWSHLCGGFCSGAAWWSSSSPIWNKGHLRNQVLNLGIAVHKTHLHDMPHLGMGWAQVATTFVQAKPGTGAPKFGLKLRPSGEYTGRFFSARWQWRQSQSSQLPKKERSSIAPVSSIVVAVKLQLLNRLFLKEECFHAVHPGGDEPRWRPLIAHLAVTK